MTSYYIYHVTKDGQRICWAETYARTLAAPRATPSNN